MIVEDLDSTLEGSKGAFSPRSVNAEQFRNWSLLSSAVFAPAFEFLDPFKLFEMLEDSILELSKAARTFTLLRDLPCILATPNRMIQQPVLDEWAVRGLDGFDPCRPHCRGLMN